MNVLSSSSLSLVIFLVSYCCVVTSDYKSGGVPHIKENDQEITAIVGEIVVLRCWAEGNPKPTTEWYKQNVPVTHTSMKYEITARSLRISKVDRDDAGVYTCRAVNGFGKAEISVRLKVWAKAKRKESNANHVNVQASEVKPWLRSPTRLIHVKKLEGSQVMLPCEIEGHPRPTFHWLKNGHILKDHRKPALLLKNLVPQHGGVYTCIGENHSGVSNMSYHIEVHVKNFSRPHVFNLSPINKTAALGSSLRLQCHVRSQVVPFIKWLKRVNEVDRGLNITRTFRVKNETYRVLKNDASIAIKNSSYLSKFIINNIRHSDGGLYVCLATNVMGYDYRSTMLVIRLPSTTELYSYDDDHSVLSRPLIIGVSVGFVLLCFVLLIFYAKRRHQRPAPALNNVHVENASRRTKRKANSKHNATPGSTPLVRREQ